MTFSSSDSLRNGRGIWKVRPTPWWQIACAGKPAISSPSKRIEPDVGRSVPAIRLKVVLLPEPFGPIRPRISPCADLKGNLVDGQEASEALGQPLDCEHRSSAWRRPTMPAAAAPGPACWMLVGQTTVMCSPAFCITTGVERSFCPDIGVPGGKNFTP